MIHTLAHLFRSATLRISLRGVALSLLLLPTLSGCAIFTQIAAAIPKVKGAAYKNLAGQSVSVIVYTGDPGVKIDNPRIQLDLEQMILAGLKDSQASDKPDELKLTRFPVSAGSVSRFQEEHPELGKDSIEQIAPMLGTSRVIYVEIRDFATRSKVSDELFRGVITGAVTVVEVTNGVGRVVPVDETLRISYPRTSPEEGLPNIGDYVIYNGTLKGFATEITKLFVPHADDPDADYGSTAMPGETGL